ncbi:MAG: hydroxyacid aldolase [Pararhodobacter sp.]|nr:hydroxyacid aldolase [Pararhodobacter sp.]
MPVFIAGAEPAVPHLTCFVSIPDPSLIEVMASSALDSLVLDMQHGMFDEASVLAGIGAAALHGKPVLVRLPVQAGGLASRMADFGAAGFICPMVNSAADAQALVDLVKYPPLGRRSWGPRRALALSGLTAPEYLSRANARIVLLAMIETKEALDELDSILATPGVDGVFVGPSDLAVSLSAGAQLTHPDVDAALPRTVAAAHRHGKRAGIFAASTSAAREALRQGFDIVSVTQDGMLLSGAIANALEAVGHTERT